jgi:acetyl-CoA decarbonylase/synthase complex subunit gamma
MALTGLQIQKLLPKTNCKECGSNTCLAFAMKLAAKKVELAKCPYVSDEAIEVLAAAAEPPIRTVEVGVGEYMFRAGGETVQYRHEKTFVNQTGIGINLDDSMADSEIESTVKAIIDYQLERVGEILQIDLISLQCRSGDEERYRSVLEQVTSKWPGPIALRSTNADLLRTAATLLKGRKPLLASATKSSFLELADVARQTNSVLALQAENFDDLYEMAHQLRDNGLKDLFLELRSDDLCEHYQNSILIRRGALKQSQKPLGFPTLKYINTGNVIDNCIEAGIEIAKYGGLLVLPEFSPAHLVSLMTLRQNIFTDPQKPIQVEPKVYPIGEPNNLSPTFVTTNFSLTYFIVSGEIENAGTSAWLLVPECEGMSVLTAWAAGKFGGDKIGAFAKEIGLEEVTGNRKIVIPGYVAQISGELEEALPNWEVIVGPQEAGDLESFVKNVLMK